MLTQRRRYQSAPTKRLSRHRFMVLFACTALMLSVLGGSLGALRDATAQETPEATAVAGLGLTGDSVIERVEPTGEPGGEATEVPTAEPEATDPPPPERVIDPGVLDAVGNVSILAIAAGCPADADPGASFEVLFGACGDEPLVGVEFTLSNSSGSITELTGTSGQAGFPNIAYSADLIPQLSQTIPAGYGDPIVFCAEDEPSYFSVMDTAGSLAIQPSSVDVSVVTCFFFNIMEAGEDTGVETGTVHLAKYTCPEGIARSAEDYALSEQCTEVIDPVEFEITDGGAYNASVYGSAGVPQNAEFTGVPFGAIEISEVVPPGYGELLAFCSDTPADGAGNYEPVPVFNGNTIAWDLRADATIPLTCLFFNFPNDGEVPVGETGTVHVTKYTCPEGVEHSEVAYILSEQCTEDIDPVEFAVSNESGFSLSQLATANASGELETTFTGVPFGGIAITETVPSGFGDLQAFCSDTPADGPGNYDPALVVDGTTIFWEHDPLAGLPLTCLFFNFHDDVDGEGNSLLVTKFNCPEGTDRTGGLPDLGTTCAVVSGVDFVTTYDGMDHAGTTDVSGNVEWTGVPAGTWSIQESIPAGYGDPRVFCGPMFTTEAPEVPAPGGLFSGEFTGPGEDMVCTVFNFLDGDDDATGTVHLSKYTCPVGYDPLEDDYLMSEQCREEIDPVDFTVSDGGAYTQTQTATAGVPQDVTFTGVPFGTITIAEQVPVGYGVPMAFCTDTPADGPGAYEPVAVTGGNGITWDHRASAAIDLNCLFFNFPTESSTLNVVKYTCPEGYDPEAAGADPVTDCPELTNGVTFTLDIPDEDDIVTTTGDAGDGEIFIGGLDPGRYVLTETIPDGIASAFVLDCYGSSIGGVRPSPLATGDTLELEIHGGEDIVCLWYNVPRHNNTSLTVVKYTCAAETFVSGVDCEIYEDGQVFDLLVWDGDSWEQAIEGLTDGFGEVTFGDLDPGQYWLDERDGTWCHLTSEQLSDDGNWLDVHHDQETIVKVYNCDREPGKPGETPTKYPDTGVPPTGPVPGGSGAPGKLPAAPLVGLLTLLSGAYRSLRTRLPVAARRPEATSPRRGTYGTYSRRTILVAAVPAVAGTTLIRSGILAQGDQVIEPRDGALPNGTPASLCLSATPDPATPAEEDCLRGPVPAQLVIETIGVDAPVEILETVGGVMQQPSDEAHVAWYKETARLGETGNILIAGHLNWWGVPEAVFFHLGTLREGDLVTLTDADGIPYRYAVQWVRQESNLEPPSEEVLGMTPYEAVTLITCGGEWDTSISEYNERTVARAIRVNDDGTPVAA